MGKRQKQRRKPGRLTVSEIVALLYALGILIALIGAVTVLREQV